MVPIIMAEAPPNTTTIPGESRGNLRNHGGEYRVIEKGRKERNRLETFMGGGMDNMSRYSLLKR
jgi:hypothetical protein